jgi:serine protease Do
VARASNEELLKRLRQTYPGSTAADRDYYRVKFRAQETHDSGAGEGSGLELARLLERTFAHAAESVSPSIVGIAAYKKSDTTSTDPAPQAGWRVGAAGQKLFPGYARATSGSGFFVSDDGKILTSAHLVTVAGALPKDWIIDVELSDNRHARAKAIGIEPTLGLALLKIESGTPTPLAPIGNNELVQAGQWAIALGDPPGAAKVFVPGTISARPVRTCYQADLLSTMLQTSIAIDPEGFGGPLVNVRGEVIGLMLPTGFSKAALQAGMVGPISALPIDLAVNIARALEVKQSQLSPWIGVSVLDVAGATGIDIDNVFEPSPASAAGIRVGDFLTKMNGQPIAGVPDFQRWLYTLGIDAGVELEIVRDGKRMTFQVKIEQRPKSASSN